MKRLRTSLFWLHLVLGIAAAGTISITAFTGAMMSFEKQVLGWLDRDRSRVVPPTEAARALSIQSLQETVRESVPGARPGTITVYADPQRAWMFQLGRTNTVYVDPYSGDIRPQGSATARLFFQTMLQWHRWLGTANPEGSGPGGGERREGNRPVAISARQIASTAVGVSSILLGILSLSGLYLWYPRSLTPARLWKAIRPQLRLQGKARDWNWHSTLGFWAGPALVVMTTTGTVMAFRDFGNWLYGRPPEPLVVSPVAADGDRGSAAGARVGSGARTASIGPDALLAIAQREFPAWEQITIRQPGGRRGPAQAGGASMRTNTGPQALTVLVHTRHAWMAAPAQLQIHPQTGEVLLREGPTDGGWRRVLRRLNRTIHTGEVAGFVGQSVALLACLTALLLVVTGLSLSVRRLMAARKRWKTSGSGLVPSVDTAKP